MTNRDFYDNSFTQAFDKNRDLAASQAFPVLMRKVYTWMALALIITGVVSYGIFSTPSIRILYLNNPAMMWVPLFVELGIVIYLSARLHKISLTTATTWFVIYSVLNGITLAPIFFVYTGTSIAKAFFITAGTFGAMAFVGATTKKDLTGLGGILLMVLLGGIIAMVVNIFLKSTMFDFILSCIMVVLFAGLTAWDSQQIKQYLLMAPDTGETSQKIALSGALNLYLDFINLFLYLLRFFGNSRD